MRLKKLLLENPDNAYMPAVKDEFEYMENLSWNDDDSYVFGYYNGKMYIERKGNHTTLHWSIPPEKRLPMDNYLSDHEWSRNMYKYPGRVWLRRKVISFWEYPPKYELQKVMRDIKKLGTPMGNLKDWKIEVIDKKGKYEAPETLFGYDSPEAAGWVAWNATTVAKAGGKIKFIPVDEYIGSEKQVGKEIQHMLSPMKKKSVAVPYGAGSRHKVPGAKSGELPVATRFRTRKGLGDNTIKLKNLINESSNTMRDAPQGFQMPESFSVEVDDPGQEEFEEPLKRKYKDKLISWRKRILALINHTGE